MIKCAQAYDNRSQRARMREGVLNVRHLPPQLDPPAEKVQTVSDATFTKQRYHSIARRLASLYHGRRASKSLARAGMTPISIIFIMVLISIVDVSANALNNTAFAAATWSTASTPTLKFGNLVPLAVSACQSDRATNSTKLETIPTEGHWCSSVPVLKSCIEIGNCGANSIQLRDSIAVALQLATCSDFSSLSSFQGAPHSSRQ